MAIFPFLVLLLPSSIICSEKPFVEPKYQRIRLEDDQDDYKPAMFFNFYEEKRSIVFDNVDEVIMKKGEIVKTLFSSKLNMLKTEDDKQILVYDYTSGKVTGFNKAWQSCFAEPAEKHSLITQLQSQFTMYNEQYQYRGLR